MKLVIRDQKQPEEETCEFWLDKSDDGDIVLKSKTITGDALKEFYIRPDLNWTKCFCGNLKDDGDE